MKQGGILSKDWFLALLLGLLFLFAVYQHFPLLERLEAIAYDHGVTMSYRAPRSTEQVAVVAIDDASIKALGQWPWPRSVLAEAVSLIAKSHPRAIVIDLPLDQPQPSSAIADVRDLQKYVSGSKWSKQDQRTARNVIERLNRLADNLDSDARLSGAIANASGVILPMTFDLTGAMPDAPVPLPAVIQRNKIQNVHLPKDASVTAARSFQTPLAQFADHALGVGHMEVQRDTAGGGRTDTLVMQYNGNFYPSLTLLAATRALGRSVRDIALDYGVGVRIGSTTIETDTGMRFYGNFYPSTGERKPFSTFSIQKLLDGNVPSAELRNRIVILGLTAAGVATPLATPLHSDLSAPERTANFITAMMNQDYFRRPAWSDWADLALIAGAIFYLMLVVPNIGARWSVVLSAVFVLSLLFAGQYVLLSEKIWLRTVSPALLIILGHLLITIRHRWDGVAHTHDAVETNRLLGLAFQGQGQLDMAMDKFRKLPVDHSVLELIYNVALDFERKRQFNKAIAAYDYVLNHDGRFRDVRDRKKRAQRAEQATMLGPLGGNGGTLVISGVDQKPTLGRYQIEREIGKGAMGTVYFGRDPRINRVVAIKTLALNEFEPDEQQKVKERFFREAETAGRLNHPNIVTIYDVGEEHDLAYIAMEFLQGKDLTHHLNEDEPSDIGWVVEVVGQVADALEYAHRQDVVHRDIKPANIMYNDEDGTVKVTDFGIARIADSTRTKTGVVLGTPSYMSPEQLAGDRVDGRTDLFSLGVMTFELLTQQQPFGGESLAALMYQITNAKHPDVTRLRRGLPSCLRGFFDRALAKKPKKRFQAGEEMKQAMLKCIGAYARKEVKN